MQPDARPASRTADAVLPPPWRARLALRFGCHGTDTVLSEARHEGPLRLQRVLRAPDGGCEALLLHPPGGVAGGDGLEIEVALAPRAEVLLSTPGAAKWYRCAGRSAHQDVRLQVGCDSLLEWLPQETILFRGADAVQTLRIDMVREARCLGWDIVQLGRVAAGEPWDLGRLRQTLELHRHGALQWREHADFTADATLRRSPTGLTGHRVFGTLWAAGPSLAANFEHALDATRAALRDTGAACPLQSGRESAQSSLCAAATWLAAPVALLLVRALGDDAERVRAALEAAWAALRPQLGGRRAQRPRIWDT